MLLSTFVICSKVDCLKNMVWGHIASDICKENNFQCQRLHLVMGRKMKEGKKKKKKNLKMAFILEFPNGPHDLHCVTNLLNRVIFEVLVTTNHDRLVFSKIPFDPIKAIFVRN